VFGLLKNIRILTKISIPAVVIAAVATGIVAYSTHSLGMLAQTTDSVVTREARRVELALDAEALFNSAAVSEKNVILFQEEEPKRQNIANYDKISAAVLQTLDQLGGITAAADQRALIETFRTAVGDRRKASASVFELALQHKDAEAFAVSVGEGAKFRKTAMDAVSKLIALNRSSLEKAQLADRVLRERLDRLGLSFERILSEFVGANATHGHLAGDQSNAPEVQLRFGVRGSDRAAVERFTREIAPLVLNGPPSVTGFAGGRPKVEEIVAYWPALIDKSVVRTKVDLIQ